MKFFAVMLTAVSALMLSAADFTINGIAPEAGFKAAENGWTFEQTYKLNKSQEPAKELKLEATRMKLHPKYKHITGYNGDVVLQIQAPGKINNLEYNVLITNFADRRERLMAVEYSIDGKTFTTLGEAKFKSGRGRVKGKLALPDNKGSITLRAVRKLAANDAAGKISYVVFNSVQVKLDGAK